MMVCEVKNSRFGDFIRRRRRELNLSQEELTIRLGTRRTYLSRLELGQHTPNLKLVTKLADSLDVPTSYLLSLIGKYDPTAGSGLQEVAFDDDIQIRMSATTGKRLTIEDLDLIKTLILKMLECE